MQPLVVPLPVVDGFAKPTGGGGAGPEAASGAAKARLVEKAVEVVRAQVRCGRAG
jgi:hypothetical protein